MDRASAERTLGTDIELVPVVLTGWQRDFNLAISNSSHYRCRICAGGRQGIAAADAQPAAGSSMAAMAIISGSGDAPLLQKLSGGNHQDRPCWCLTGGVFEGIL
jgi:hypothetical protein